MNRTLKRLTRNFLRAENCEMSVNETIMPDITYIRYFFRKPQPQYFSIEKVFEQVMDSLPENIVPSIYRLKSGTNGIWGRVKALIEVWKNKGIINHITGDVTFIAMVLPKNGLVVTYHDLESLAQYKGWRGKLIKFFWVTIPVRRASVVTAISNHTKEQLIKWTNCHPDKIEVIPNPLPTELVYTPKKFNTEYPTILLMGTKANKNVEGIFEAVGLLESEVRSGKFEEERGERREETNETEAETDIMHKARCTKHYKVILVGKMTEEQRALAAKKQLDIENLVHVPYDQILDAYKRCDILCFPSFYEGFGLPIIEAQATGRPVITSNFGAMKEVAGKGAVLVNPENVVEVGETISQIVADESLRDVLIEEGKINSKKYSSTAISNKYVEVYKRIN